MMYHRRYIPGDYKIGSLICVPVCIRENRYGVINVSRKKGTHFISADLRLASAIAFQAASSIENSEFYEELEEKVKARTRELDRANQILNLEVEEHKKTKHKLEEEVKQAGEYIRKILPDPITGHFMSVRWRFVPSALLGGDSFGYRWIDDDHFAIYLIDVCGHGVGAALLSVSIVNVLRSGSVSDKDMKDPGKVLSLLNSMFPASENHHNYFSIWYGVIHKGKNKLTCSGGGHPHPLAVTEDGKIMELFTQNPSVGILPDYTFESCSFTLNRIRKILIFSDGVFEIRDHSGKTNSFQDFKHILHTVIHSETLLEDLEHYSDQLNDMHKFDDDYTMIEVQFT